MVAAQNVPYPDPYPEATRDPYKNDPYISKGYGPYVPSYLDPCTKMTISTYVRIIVVHDPASHRSPFQDVDIGPKIRHMVALANRNGDTTVNMDGSSDQIP